MSEILFEDCLLRNKVFILRMLWMLFRIYPSEMTHEELCRIVNMLSKEHSQLIALFDQHKYNTRILNIQRTKGYDPYELHKLLIEMKARQNHMKDVKQQDCFDIYPA